MKKSLVTGAGGFIGGYLVKSLISQGIEVRAVDLKPLNLWYQVHKGVENIVCDLSIDANAEEVTKDISATYNLAADMGGMGFIESNRALCMLSVLINTNLIKAARHQGVDKYFFASSACVYNQTKQQFSNIPGLKEEDAYPADPEDGYGWEKLFSERMCRHFTEDFGLKTRVARFHNVYGPNGTWDGGREKAPAAICRKIAQAKISGNHKIEIWGDGEQSRSFTYIEDTIIGINLLMASSFSNPINLGSDEMVTINQLVDIVEGIAEIKLERSYNLEAPKGVRGRNSENTLISKILGWQPSISLQDGMEHTYKWIYEEVKSGRKSMEA